MSLTVLHGDCVEQMKTLPDQSVDCCVTDPPYHLTTNKKGGSGPKSASLKTPAGRARITTGFMGQAWDGGDVAFRPEVWREVLRLLKPGGHLLSFGGTRTYHRMVCAIEDAGFEIRDQIGWLYGSGFPKSLDVSKAIDKEAGAERKLTRPGKIQRDGYGEDWDTGSSQTRPRFDSPVTDAAKQWEGWGTALKPAWEPIVLARKPIIGTVAENVRKYGTGALNIDACRIEGPAGNGVWGSSNKTVNPKRIFVASPDAAEYKTEQYPKGRWPANVVHDGSDEVLSAFPDAVGAIHGVGPQFGSKPTVNCYGDFGPRLDMQPRGDSGSAARFFYCAKVSRADREAGMTGEKRNLSCSSGEQSPGTFQSPNTDRQVGNFHPTVKPTALMRWLVQLVCPVGGTVMDPFAGSGTTGRAALELGRKVILIELNPDYIKLIEQRCNVTPGLAL